MLECFPPLHDRHCFDNMGSNWIELGQGRQNGQSINSNSSYCVLNTRLSTYIYMAINFIEFKIGRAHV